jgi:hypothetical protein
MADMYPPAGGMESPANSAFAITPNDNSNLSVTTRALYVGGSGNLVATLAGDTAAVTFTGLQAGYHPLRVKKVSATGTTCTAILGLL